MLLGLSSFTYGWSVGVAGSMPSRPMTATALVNKTVEAGLRVLQIGDNLPLHELTQQQRDDLKSLLGKHNITLEVGARKLTDEHLERYIGLARFFNASLLRFVVDGDQYEPETEITISIVRNAISQLKENKVILGIENHDRFKARELADMIDAIGSEQVGICLDCVNSLGAGEGLEWVSSVLAPYTVNLHIKDFLIRRFPHNMGFTVTGIPTGQGMINVPWIVEKLHPYKRCKTGVLEQWVTPASDIEDTVRKEHAWAEEGLHYLKQLDQFK